MKNKSFNSILLRGTIACLTFVVSPIIFAVTDATSADISLQFTEVIDVANVGNVQIQDPGTGTNATAIEDFCVAGTGFSTFEISFESDDGNNDTVFELTDGTNNVDYAVGFDNSTGGAFTNVTEGTPIIGQTLNDIAADCTSVADNARFQITILNADWENATILSGSNYTDVLTITVTSL
ncbi:hypothetical protein MO867_15250 [Microbulbifer sp. OS29]|uniref:Spore coat protein U (SCPU) domain-containing protein n=1 Tax=Microbulbifer okhotskensis TaxID=2926617 RepID=A0A9X2ENV4_9GAMM|nr:hypothetical protein [Microbulbifer okhotskensis]MCO1335692.1 hypothetical protein [Microbulbifer okhotskensis]